MNDRGRKGDFGGWRPYFSRLPRLAAGVEWLSPGLRWAGGRVRGIGLAVVSFLLVCWLAWTHCGLAGCPDPRALVRFQVGGAPVLLDRNGDVLAAMHPWGLRVTPLDSLPPYLAAAFVATEDRRFFGHHGVDWLRALGAARANLAAGEVLQGGSTITMQVARTLFPERIPGTDRTLGRKAVEARVAGLIEDRFAKEEILELYLNHVYVGAGLNGVEAGALHYFAHRAGDLTLAESALLAGIVRAPAHYDPRQDPEAALERRNLVLQLMVREGVVDAEEAERAALAPLGVVPEPPAPERGPFAPYFVDAVQSEVDEVLGPARSHAAHRVHTTLDPALQTIAEEELLRQIEAIEALAGEGPANRNRDAGDAPLQGAVVFLDPGTGDILALVGGRDFRTAPFDRVGLGRRQMGSAFKPIVYAAAIASGFVASQPIADRPLTLRGAEDEPWSPRNFDDDFRGTVSMRDALVQSLNVPTVRLAMAVGLDRVARTAESFGIEDVPRLPAAALGTTAVSPLEAAAAYGVFASGGAYARPRAVLRVESVEGEVLFESEPRRRDVLDPRVAFIVTDMLEDAVRFGTGSGALDPGPEGPVAGKTGTTQGSHDAWFIGFTPEVVGLVWIGYDRPRPILTNASGGGLAAPVWGRIMSRAGPRYVGVAWPRPAGVVSRTVDPATGAVVGPLCRTPDDAVVELFLAETVPAEACPERKGLLARIGGFFASLLPAPHEPVETPAPGDGVLGVERVPLAEPAPGQ